MKIWQRTLLFLAVYVCVLVLPWWLTAVILVGLSIYVPFYVEVVFFGFLFDTLYNATNGHKGLIVATIFILIISFVRTRVRT